MILSANQQPKELAMADDDKMDYLDNAKSSTAATEDETGLEQLVFIVAAAVIAIAIVALLPVVAQVIAFAVIFKWLMTKICR